MPDATDSEPRRKQIRLALDAYANIDLICSITIATRCRLAFFTDHELSAAAILVLRAQAAATTVRVFAYCVMPDHVHLILSPSPSCSLTAFVGSFKSLVQRSAWAMNLEGRMWQRSFWDRFLRSNEALETAIEYVLDNPVRAGLVSARSGYEFSGSPEKPWLKGSPR